LLEVQKDFLDWLEGLVAVEVSRAVNSSMGTGSGTGGSPGGFGSGQAEASSVWGPVQGGMGSAGGGTGVGAAGGSASNGSHGGGDRLVDWPLLEAFLHALSAVSRAIILRDEQGGVVAGAGSGALTGGTGSGTLAAEFGRARGVGGGEGVLAVVDRLRLLPGHPPLQRVGAVLCGVLAPWLARRPAQLESAFMQVLGSLLVPEDGRRCCSMRTKGADHV
ncbi:unnamed protein product, partial [Choristocarpus tenellus]